MLVELVNCDEEASAVLRVTVGGRNTRVTACSLRGAFAMLIQDALWQRRTEHLA